jgi:hypothetical protein
MILAALLLLSTTNGSPDDRAFETQAKRCGIKRDQVIWSTDEGGHRTRSITPKGKLESLNAQSVVCILNWAKRTGTSVGFISEPPSTR